MLSQNNEYLKEAYETVYHLTQEEKVHLQCQTREDYYLRMKGIQEKLEHFKAEKIQSDAEIADPKQQIAALKKELEAKSRENPCFFFRFKREKAGKSDLFFTIRLCNFTLTEITVIRKVHPD